MCFFEIFIFAIATPELKVQLMIAWNDRIPICDKLDKAELIKNLPNMQGLLEKHNLQTTCSVANDEFSLKKGFSKNFNNAFAFPKFCYTASVFLSFSRKAFYILIVYFWSANCCLVDVWLLLLRSCSSCL